MKVDVLGIGFDDIDLDRAVSQAIESIQNRDEKAYVVTPNPEIAWMARRDETLRNALNGASLVLPDGIGIIMVARILGTPLRCGRVPGIDFAAALLQEMAQCGISIFLLGAKPGIAERAALMLGEKYPGLKTAGEADGYFTDDDPIIERINAAQPDVLFVCLGAGKQEIWISENLKRLDVRLCAGLGGCIDVFAGNAKRAPVFFQKLGLEWLYRLFREPRRIKRMIKLPLFVLVLIWKRLFGNRG